MSAAPPAFNPRTSFSTLAQQPITTTGLPGSQLDGEFSRAADSINQIRDRLSEVQRDDGKLRNGVVNAESLSADVRNLFVASGTKPVTWAIGAQFSVGDLVSNPPGTPGTYLCITAHTSSSLFVSDLSKWALIAAPPTVGFLYTNTFTGDGTTTVFNLTQDPTSIDSTQLFIDGIYQPKSGYSINGQLLTITPPPAAGSDIEISIGVPSDTSIVTVTDGTISTEKIQTSAVTNDKIAPFAITEEKLADASVSSAKILSSAVSTGKLENGAVTNAKIAQEAITADKIASESVTNSKLAPGSVSTDKIANSSITQTKIATDSITTSAIVDGAVTQAKAGNMLLPSGAVMAFAMNSAPAGWLAANGALVSTTTYASLFAAIGYTYGGSGGSFNLPDLRGYFVRGAGTNSDGTASGTFGAKQADAFKSHNHTVVQTIDNQGSYDSGSGRPRYGGSGDVTGSTGSTETRPRNIAMLYCIKI